MVVSGNFCHVELQQARKALGQAHKQYVQNFVNVYLKETEEKVGKIRLKWISARYL
jgi:hypothetical protein